MTVANTCAICGWFPDDGFHHPNDHAVRHNKVTGTNTTERHAFSAVINPSVEDGQIVPQDS